MQTNPHSYWRTQAQLMTVAVAALAAGATCWIAPTLASAPAHHDFWSAAIAAIAAVATPVYVARVLATYPEATLGDALAALATYFVSVALSFGAYFAHWMGAMATLALFLLLFSVFVHAAVLVRKLRHERAMDKLWNRRVKERAKL